jgi:hypothetical protein
MTYVPSPSLHDYSLLVYSWPTREGEGFNWLLPFTQTMQHRSQMQDWWNVGKISLLCETTVTMPLYSPQIQYWMAWVQTQVSAVICHRITACAMVRLPVQPYGVNLSPQPISVVAREYFSNTKPSHCRQIFTWGVGVTLCYIHEISLHFKLMRLILWITVYSFLEFYYLPVNGVDGLEVACWPLVPKFAGSNQAEAVGILRAKKILSTPSFGGEVKPSVPWLRFAARKISLQLRGILGQIRRNISRPRRFHSTFRC